MAASLTEPMWYPSVPPGWTMSRVKAAVQRIDSGVWGDDPYDGEGTPVVRSNEIDEGGNWRDTTPAMRALAASEREKALLRQGDLLIVKSSGSSLHIGKTAVVTQEIESLGSCFSNFTGRIRVHPHRTSSRFLWYFLNNSPGRDQLFYYGTTTTGLINLSATSIGAGVLVLPSLPEQERIVAYLDASCVAIDAAVAAKRRQLETLDTLRKTVITRALTLGLKPDVRTRPSGQDWLGEIPQHWSPLCLKRLLCEPLTYGLNEAAELEDRDLPRYLRITDFDDDGTLRDDTFRSLPLEVARDALLQPDDVLFARSGATVGKTFMFRDYSGEACFAGYLIRARTLPWKLDAQFLYLFTKTLAYDAWKNLIFTQATIQNISAAKYNYLTIPVPPLPEQQAIVAHVREKDGEYRRLAAQLERQIATLTAYRKSLIHECVTGQRRVTEADLRRARARG